MHAERPPHPFLKDLVKCLWTSEREFAPPHDTFDVFPDSYIELIFNFGVPCRLERGGVGYDLPPVYVVGLLNEPFRLRASGTVKVVAARFYAWGFAPLLGFVAGPETPSVHHVNRTLDALHADLKEQLSAGDQALLGSLHRFLLEQRLSTHIELGPVAAAAKKLLESSGDLRIAEVAAECGLSRRQLERLFNASLGMTPKALAVRGRFERVRDTLAYHPETDLVSLAFACGYADQAHLTREFRTFSGRTPHRFAADMRATHDVLQLYHDAFFQDARASGSLD